MFDAIKPGHFANFNDRASRKEYWLFQLLVILISLFFAITAQYLPLLSANTTLIHIHSSFHFAVSLVLIIPALAVNIRRLHDINMSGWWLLLLFPFMFVIGLIPGHKGKNRFGKDPLKS